MYREGFEYNNSIEKEKNNWDKKKQLANHNKSCQKGHKKRKSKKHIK